MKETGRRLVLKTPAHGYFFDGQDNLCFGLNGSDLCLQI